MKLLLIKPMAENHLYSHLAHALRRALADLGHDAILSDQSARAPDGGAPTGPLIADLQRHRPDAVVSFSSFFGELTLSNGAALFDHLGVKFVGWQLDHPIYAPPALSHALQGRCAIYANYSHLQYARAVKLPGRAITLLPGGDLPGAPPRDHRSRELPILVAATWNGVPQRLWEQAPASPGRALLMGVVDTLLQDRNASLIDAFDTTSARLKLGARLGDDPQFDATMNAFLREPLTYVRNIDRIAVIRALIEAGLPLTLCGAGWQDYFGERRNVTYLGRVDVARLHEMYGEARVVVNLNAGNGACERAVYAALAGAAVASDESEELDALLGRGEGVAAFNRAKPETAAQVVGGLLESAAGEALAQRGHERAVRSGLWRHRAEQLVAFVAGQDAGVLHQAA